MEKVYEIFNDAQMSIATHNSGVKKLNSFFEQFKNDNEKIKLMNAINKGCLDRLLAHPTKEAYAERAMKFYCDFVSRY